MLTRAGRKLTRNCQKFEHFLGTIATRFNARGVRTSVEGVSVQGKVLGQSIPSAYARSISTTAAMAGKLLNMETLNPNIKNVEYAVRGPIVQLASKLEKELSQVRYGLLQL